MLIPKQNRIRDKAHRRWIASLSCVVSGVHGETQAAHVSAGRYSLGMKASDSEILPLSVTEHLKQHTSRAGEKGYWECRGGIDRAKQLAADLYSVSGDTDYANMLILRFRMKS